MPLPDNRRINGPTETFQISSFIASKDTDKERTASILNDKGERRDQRRADEVRPIYLKAGNLFI